MELKLFYVLVVVFATFVDNSIQALKYEQISDCHFQNLGTIPGIDHVTFICGEANHTRDIFVDGKAFKCSNRMNAEGNKWPGKINFENCEFREFPINFLDRFVSLHTLIASDLGMESIEIKLFRDIKTLTHLDVSQNRLPAIPPLLFYNAEKLSNANFKNNSIEQIDSLAFLGANKLKTLNLSYNKIKQLDSNTFSTPNLLELDLSMNNLGLLGEHTFDNITTLKHMNLSFNPIGDLKIDTFAHLTNLEILDLKQTNISVIHLGTFSHQHKLIVLDLSENNLIELDFNHFLPSLPDLRSLYLDENKLKTLNGFGNVIFPQLTLLDIRSNHFNCSYLENFMRSVNWDKLRLPIDRPTVKTGEASIRGINCEIIADNRTIDTTTHNKDSMAKLTMDNTLVDTLSTMKENINNLAIIMNIYLLFICISVFIFLIVFVIANLDQICRRQVIFQHQENNKPSSSGHTVEFKNHSEVLLIKER